MKELGQGVLHGQQAYCKQDNGCQLLARKLETRKSQEIQNLQTKSNCIRDLLSVPWVFLDVSVLFVGCLDFDSGGLVICMFWHQQLRNKYEIWQLEHLFVFVDLG